MKENIAGVRRLGDRLIAIKLLLDEDMIYIISTCTLQERSDGSVKDTILE